MGIKVTVVEPGGVRTDFSGSLMRVGAVRPDYQKTVGAMIEARRGNADIMRGDPAKVARAILRVASERRPPLRLLLGSDAVFLAFLALAERAEEDAEWKELSLSTDFDSLADFSEKPIAKMLSEKELRNTLMPPASPYSVGAPKGGPFAAEYPARTFPCQRFDTAHAGGST